MDLNKPVTKNGKFFFECCKTKFNYLIEEFQFSLIATQKDGNLYEVVFQNDTTAVIINWDRSENWLYIELYRLVNGKLVLDPINISSQNDLNGYYFDDLLLIRYPGYSLVRLPDDKHGVSETLDNYATLLHEYARDILNGDFTIFHELEKIVKDRIASNK